MAERVEAKYVVAFTQSGDSARRMSRLRGPIPILAFTPEATVRSQLALSWGVETFKTVMVEHTDEMVRQVDEQLLEIGRLAEGDLVVIIAGSPPGIPGSTNALRIHRMGDAVNEVTPAYQRTPSRASGTTCDARLSTSARSAPSSRATPARVETLIVVPVRLTPRDLGEVECPTAQLADVGRVVRELPARVVVRASTRRPPSAASSS